MKKTAMVIVAAFLAAASVTTAGKAVKAAEAPEEAQVTDSGTQTKETNHQFFFEIQGVEMLTAVQKGTWVYGGAASGYPYLPTKETNVYRTNSADGTMVYSLAATEVSHSGGSVKGTIYRQDIDVSLWGQASKTVYCATTFYENGTYEYTQTTANVTFTKSR